MQTIPLQPVPSQSLAVVLGGQNCQLLIQQKTQGLFVDINSDGVDVVNCVIARDAVSLMCRQYLGFVGNLMFIDTHGSSDPEASGLGSRFQLVYFSAEEYALL